MTLTEYRIDTGFFAGPLDLMLYLVRKVEVDICEVSLSKITSDFVDYIEVLEFVDFDLIGDFVVVASTLLEIKSREVLPTQAERQPLYEQAQVIFKEQAPWATIAHSVVYMTMRPEVEGYVVHPLGGHIFNAVGLSQ